VNNEVAGGNRPPPLGTGRKHDTLRLDLLYFSHASLLGGSYCLRHTSHIFADIIWSRHQTLRRIYVGAQIATSFCTRAPNVQKLRFSSEIESFLCGKKATWQDLSVRPGSVYGDLLNPDKNGRLNRTQIVLWHAEH